MCSNVFNVVKNARNKLILKIEQFIYHFTCDCALFALANTNCKETLTTYVHFPIPIANPNRKVVGTCTLCGDDLRGDGKRSQDGEDRHQEAPGDRFAIGAKLADK
jgi:hypothetical protein